MKSILLILITTIITYNVSTANTYPIEGFTIIEGQSVEMKVDEGTLELFTHAIYNSEDSSLEFTLVSDVRYIQIYDTDNELQMQLPVHSHKVKFNKSIFSGIGDYKLGFMMEGDQEIHFTQVTIK